MGVGCTRRRLINQCNDQWEDQTFPNGRRVRWQLWGRCFWEHLCDLYESRCVQMEYKRWRQKHAQDVSSSICVQSMCVQMEYKWNTEVVAHMHKMFHGAPLFNQGVFILGVHIQWRRRINTNALFDVVGLIDFQVCNRYRAQKNKSTVLKASMKTVSCVLFQFFRRAFRRGM